MDANSRCNYINHSGCRCEKSGTLTKGYCTMHYKRFCRHGDAGFVMAVRGEGRRKHPLYRTWQNIKTRCYNKNCKYYSDYGGRGIRVCKEWLNDFNVFCTDMGEKPTPRHSIERDDVNGDYCKSNCRWATIHEQQANKRNNSKNVGVFYFMKKNTWIAMLTINKAKHRKSFHEEYQAIAYRKKLEETYLTKTI